jgi:trehalose 6-phosphate phosphatase
MEAAPAGEDSKLSDLLAPLREGPDRSAVLTDVDGTIAPIAERPEQAEVLPRARELLHALAERYALVGCISGRPALEARRMVGLDDISYSGNHGLELLLPGDTEPQPDPALAGHEGDAAAFVSRLDKRDLERLGIRVEDKGAIVALHWRGSPNVGEAEAYINEVASEVEWDGLVTHLGRMVLEIRPDVSIDKGRAMTSLLANGEQIDAALYAGDDRTDLDAFRALAELLEADMLRAAVRVGIASDEAPPEVRAEADLVVPGPEGFLEVLEALAA